MVGTQVEVRGGGLGMAFWLFLLLASALCCNSEVSKLYAKGQTVHSSGVSGLTASVTAQLGIAA